MGWVLAVIFGFLWALAMVSSTKFGGSIHIFIASAAVALVYQVIRNRRAKAFKKGV